MENVEILILIEARFGFEPDLKLDQFWDWASIGIGPVLGFGQYWDSASFGVGPVLGLGQFWVGPVLGLGQFWVGPVLGSGQFWGWASFGWASFGLGQFWVGPVFTGQLWVGQLCLGQFWGVIELQQLFFIILGFCDHIESIFFFTRFCTARNLCSASPPFKSLENYRIDVFISKNQANFGLCMFT